MKFKRQVKFETGLAQFDMTPLIDVIFLLLIFFMLSSSFTFQSGINVKLPKAVTSDVIHEENFTISITSENVIYLNGEVISLSDLKRDFQARSWKDIPVMIRADRRASMGRIVDVWDLCRELGIQRINIATNAEY